MTKNELNALQISKQFESEIIQAKCEFHLKIM